MGHFLGQKAHSHVNNIINHTPRMFFSYIYFIIYTWVLKFFELIKFLNSFLIISFLLQYRHDNVGWLDGKRKTIISRMDVFFTPHFLLFHRTLHALLLTDIWEFVIWGLYSGINRILLCWKRTKIALGIYRMNRALRNDNNSI